MTVTTKEFADELEQQDFSSEDYVNKRLSLFKNLSIDDFLPGQRDNSTFEATVSDLLLDIHLKTDEIVKDLDSQVDMTMGILPKLLLDIEDFRNQLNAVRLSALETQKELEAIESRGQDAFENLSKLETVRSRMDECFTALKEADKWKNIDTEVMSLIEKSHIQQAAARIFEADKSLSIMQSSKEFEEKKRVLVRLQNNVEAVVSPLLVIALGDHDFEAIKTYHQVFSKISRSDEFFSLYCKSRRSLIQSYWKELDDSGGVSWINEKLRRFYEEAYLIFSRDSSWCPILFPDLQYAKTLDLMKQVFTLLKPTLNERLQTLKAQFMGEKFIDLIDCFVQTEIFILWVEKGIMKQRENSENVISVTGTFANDWADPLLKPFLGFQKEYATFERVFLSTRAKSVMQIPKTSFVDRCKRLFESISKLLLEAEFSIDRCVAFTHGLSMGDLVGVLHDHMQDNYRWIMEALKSLPTAKSPKSPQSSSDDDELDEAIVYDWSAFQSAVRLLLALDGFSKRLGKFDIILSDKIKEFSGNSPYSFDYDLFETDEDYVRQRGTMVSNQLLSGELLSTKPLPNNSLVDEMSPGFFNAVLACQHVILSRLFQPLQQHLSGVNQMKQWREKEDKNAPQASIQGLTLPTFNLSPSPYIHTVGEHLLTLPQHLDVSLSQQSQQDTNSILWSTSLGLWIEWLPLIVKAVSTGVASATITSSLPIAKHETDPYAAAHKWLISVCNATISYYIFQQILKISPGISQYGWRQLQTDIGYMMNVLQALGLLDEDELGEELQNLQLMNQCLQIIIMNKDESLSELLNNTKKGLVGDSLTVDQQKISNLILKHPKSSERIITQLLIMRK